MPRPRPIATCNKCYGTGLVHIDEYAGDGYGVSSVECECIARQYEPDNPMNLFVIREKKTWRSYLPRILLIAAIIVGAYALGSSLL